MYKKDKKLHIFICVYVPIDKSGNYEISVVDGAVYITPIPPYTHNVTYIAGQNAQKTKPVEYVFLPRKLQTGLMHGDASKAFRSMMQVPSAGIN